MHDISIARNLQEYIDENSNVEEKAVIAWAANAESNTKLTYIFYLPEEGTSDIRYYELTDPTSDINDFINYKRQSLDSKTVFDAKLERFSRSGGQDTWCLVTYEKEGVLKISPPIKLNSTSKPTTYSNSVTMAYKTTLEPNFTWEDGTRKESVLYFQAISDYADDFISGTFTEDTFFQYYDTKNVLENPKLNTTEPKKLVADEIYNFTMMGIGADNWVNLIIEEQFIPRNLEEYIAVNSDKTMAVALAFGGTANGNKEETYIYFYPIEGAFNYRYYETENTTVSRIDFSNYKRRSLKDIPQFDGKLRRFSHSSSAEVWCLITYISDGKLYISAPIKTKNNTRQTAWKTEVDIDYAKTLKPIFTWSDSIYAESETYFQVFTKSDDTFLSGTFTKEKTFQYSDASNVIDVIHTDTPPDLVLDDNYKFILFGISGDNWINMVIQNTFIAQ